jgi:CheY-like chemotaxis protein
MNGYDPPAAPPVPLRVLVADDSASVRVAIRKILLLLGHEVDTVCDGAEALAAMVHKPYDVALVDLQMPVMGGQEATSRLRRSTAVAWHPYIIAISADDSPAERARCRAAGMDEFLPKPILADQLAAALERGSQPVARQSSV